MQKFLGVQTCEDFDSWPGKISYLQREYKYDGFRLVAWITNGKVEFYCRDPEPVLWGANLKFLADELLELGFDNCGVDSEVVCGGSWGGTGLLKKGCSKKGYVRPPDEVLAAIRAGTTMHVFDMLPHKDIASFTGSKSKKPMFCVPTPLDQRRAELEKYLVGSELTGIVRLVPQTRVQVDSDVEAELQKALAAGYEGLILKHPTSSYIFGKRMPTWRKVKPQKTEDVEIIGFVEGEGKYVGVLGAIICKNSNGTTVRLGTGIDDDQRRDIWARREELMGTIAEMKSQATDVAEARHPVLIRLRPDRSSL